MKDMETNQSHHRDAHCTQPYHNNELCGDYPFTASVFERQQRGYKSFYSDAAMIGNRSKRSSNIQGRVGDVTSQMSAVCPEVGLSSKEVHPPRYGHCGHQQISYS